MKCSHIDQIDPDIKPRTPEGCEECLKTGDSWVALRVCQVCGHVGCCDSSKNKHARAHYHDTAHAIIAPLNPYQQWMWCYPDDAYVERDGTLK